MAFYEKMAEVERRFKEFPKIDAAYYAREVNKLFTPYIFVHNEKKGRHIWCSCCNREEVLSEIPRTMTPAHISIWWGKHNDEGFCPYCGAAVTIKETGRLGKKKKLLEYHPVVFLSEKKR